MDSLLLCWDALTQPALCWAAPREGSPSACCPALLLSRSLQGAAEAVTAGGHSAEAELDRRASAVWFSTVPRGRTPLYQRSWRLWRSSFLPAKSWCFQGQISLAGWPWPAHQAPLHLTLSYRWHLLFASDLAFQAKDAKGQFFPQWSVFLRSCWSCRESNPFQKLTFLGITQDQNTNSLLLSWRT